MAKIGLSEGFSLIPEGTHVFKIVKVNYKEDFGKLEITMETASGQKHMERFSLLDKKGETNQGALNAFSYFAKTALDDFSAEEIDPEELVGYFIRCEVTHEEVESNRTAGKMLKFVRLGEKEPCDGFDEAETPPPAARPAPEKKDQGSKGKAAESKPAESQGTVKPKFDLNSLLG